MSNICCECEHWESRDRQTSAMGKCKVGIGSTAFNDTCRAFKAIVKVLKAGEQLSPDDDDHMYGIYGYSNLDDYYKDIS